MSLNKNQKIYLSGAMTGLPDYNYPAFNKLALQLRDAGYEVANPAENNPPSCNSWQGWMRIAIAQMVTCDAVVMLEGWEKSKGANIEFDLAVKIGMPAFFEQDFLRVKLAGIDLIDITPKRR